MEQIDTTKIMTIGSSMYIRIPAPIARVMNLHKGVEMNVYRDGNRILYEKSDMVKK